MSWVYSELEQAKASGRTLQELRDEMEQLAREQEGEEK